MRRKRTGKCVVRSRIGGSERMNGATDAFWGWSREDDRRQTMDVWGTAV